jgi:DNA-binding MarR family transcriptional regulator
MGAGRLTNVVLTTILDTPSRASPGASVDASPRGAGRRTWRFETVETKEREIYLLLQHVSGELIHELATLLKPAGITPEQYHVLRILEDAGSAGIQLSAVAERSPAGDPDVTRLLDRLEQRGLARRAREAADRRVVTARLTGEGRRLLDKLEEPVAALHARQLGPLGERGLRELRRLLKQVAAVGPVI